MSLYVCVCTLCHCIIIIIILCIMLIYRFIKILVRDFRDNNIINYKRIFEERTQFDHVTDKICSRSDISCTTSLLVASFVNCH